MHNEHFPIVPSSELIKLWIEDWHKAKVKHDDIIGFVACQAARWGSDQELEACCEWLKGTAHIGIDFELINARRPKPPSLKDEVQEIIECLVEGDCVNDEDAAILRRILEFLPD